MMKRMFSIGFFVLLFALCYGQDVKVNINNQEVGGQKEDCAFRINGICSSEDIGGVDVQRMTGDTTYGVNAYGRYPIIGDKLVFTNYNSFTVTVLYQIRIGKKFFIGQMVLRRDESKEFKPKSVSSVSLEGIIVRKLKN